MKLDPKKLFTYLDLPDDIVKAFEDDDDPIDKFKEHFEEKFITKKMALHDEDIKLKLTGTAFGKITAHLIRDSELSHSDVEDKTVEEVFDLIDTEHKEKVTELEKQVVDAGEGKGTDDEAVKKLKDDLELKTNKVKELDDLILEGNKKIEEMNTERDSERKNDRVKWGLNEMTGQIKFKDGISTLEINGFNQLIKDNYRFDYDENDLMTVKDLKGEQIKNEKKTGFLTPGDVLSMEAGENKLLKVNNLDPDKKPPVAPDVKHDDGSPKRAMHPGAEANVEALQGADQE